MYVWLAKLEKVSIFCVNLAKDGDALKTYIVQEAREFFVFFG